MNTNYQVLLYYKYVEVIDPEKLRDEQRKLCERLHLKGRIIVAKEGINGTLEGLQENTEQYIVLMQQINSFADIVYKKSVGTGNSFPKLSVKVRPEIVTSEVQNLNPNVATGKYITAEELHQWFLSDKEFYIVDMRNDYEYASGYFEGSLLSDFAHFKELPNILPKLEKYKNKTIVTVCTGGVRCEKASGFLVTNGFVDVYQLKDGIQTYMELYPNEHFKGKLYVFDNRITIGFNTSDSAHEIVGKCVHCHRPSDSYVNCANDTCHKHYICCEDCRDTATGLAFCDEHCKEEYSKISFARPDQL